MFLLLLLLFVLVLLRLLSFRAIVPLLFATSPAGPHAGYKWRHYSLIIRDTERSIFIIQRGRRARIVPAGQHLSERGRFFFLLSFSYSLAHSLSHILSSVLERVGLSTRIY